ncbi:MULTISPECIES: hypothetical protein [unclassified Parafrankia]|uniref:hypothetical protein n=1 Tax=unclassified Parafrankia TaxID=2994368 RepID=UPI000DA453B0|nr:MULTISPECIES: hypothetical protein [unclassified Parafrankia]TCJ31582.1 hypothetical protein E0504_47660 [Parafrankia sp. BMG5.11]CAI7978159.1 conserved hypothetical protein [Frankia sp. Hr75.2]SQD99953.1 hypothetical protein FMEAI12_5940015 [Parafrankia sp. Ea1.12]
MAKRALPPRVPALIGDGTEFDSKEFLRMSVDVLADIDVDALDEAGKVAYAQALALVAIASNAKHLQHLPLIEGNLEVP